MPTEQQNGDDSATDADHTAYGKTECFHDNHFP